MAETGTSIVNIQMPTLQFCDARGRNDLKVDRSAKGKDIDTTILVDKIFKVFGAEKSGKLTRSQIYDVDKKDDNASRLSRDENIKTLSKADIQKAFWGDDFESIIKEDKTPLLSVSELTALLGGCYSQEGVGNSLVITREQAIKNLSKNKEHKQFLESFMKII